MYVCVCARYVVSRVTKRLPQPAMTLLLPVLTVVVSGVRLDHEPSVTQTTLMTQCLVRRPG